MCPRSLRISFHKPLRVDTRVLPLSRKGSGSMLHQVGLAFLPAVTPEPASAFLLQALAHPFCCPWLHPTYSVSSADSTPVETLLGGGGV